MRLILSLKRLEKELHSELINACVGREGAGRLCKILLMHSHSCFGVAEFVQYHIYDLCLFSYPDVCFSVPVGDV